MAAAGGWGGVETFVTANQQKSREFIIVSGVRPNSPEESEHTYLCDHRH